MIKKLIVLFAIGCAFSSCDPNRVFEKNIKLSDHEWDKDVSLDFSVDIQDTIGLHNMYLNVRHAGYYQYRNIFLFIKTELPNGVSQIDTAECLLASPEGKWMGDGLGDIWDNQILFKKGFKFPLKGTYNFELTQAMRVNPLQGIMDAGIRIEKDSN
ncbi:MAG: gliding motility lipoprotein GldH [Bacteroidia bacterium]|nr:gliding motility lipoprotein GldH [Bacteroidia bacterium]NNC86487.1 gliding motility lipoprotein GldH [Bacteroidia bacterium]NNM16866.1 gliding motility lipoprotein GldH [Bacteroidia bacterium]